MKKRPEKTAYQSLKEAYRALCEAAEKVEGLDGQKCILALGIVRELAENQPEYLEVDDE